MRIYDKISAVAKRRGFVWPSSEIYGGLGGFFDYGPVGALLKRNIENEWRKLFIIKEGMFEIETPNIMQKDVFVASGHLDHFADPLVECTKCKESYRADNLIKEKLNLDAEAMGNKELNDLISKNRVSCPKCKSKLSKVFKFNLMFPTEVGPGKNRKTSYLRPETAQGMFVSFPRLYNVARKKLPFGVCQIGKAYRNEISPRQGMIRLREFTQAEAEIFYNPEDRTHSKFKNVKNDILPLYPKEYQESDKAQIKEMSVENAVKKGLIKSEMQAYYLDLSEKFFENMGIPRKYIRCRQQLDDEKAHYSVDTWDVEIKSEDFGWIEVCAVADRTDYDLKGHSALSKEEFAVDVDGKKIVPHVMEASFGIDRPFYCLLEHCYTESEKRVYMNFKEELAPIKACVFPLVSKDKLPKKAQQVHNNLVKQDILAFYDEKGSIGKRYARADEIGVPVCITVDYQTLKDNTVTVRDRNTTKQKRVKIDKL